MNFILLLAWARNGIVRPRDTPMFHSDSAHKVTIQISCCLFFNPFVSEMLDMYAKHLRPWAVTFVAFDKLSPVLAVLHLSLDFPGSVFTAEKTPCVTRKSRNSHYFTNAGLRSSLWSLHFRLVRLSHRVLNTSQRAHRSREQRWG